MDRLLNSNFNLIKCHERMTKSLEKAINWSIETKVKHEDDMGD